MPGFLRLWIIQTNQSCPKLSLRFIDCNTNYLNLLEVYQIQYFSSGSEHPDLGVNDNKVHVMFVIFSFDGHFRHLREDFSMPLFIPGVKRLHLVLLDEKI